MPHPMLKKAFRHPRRITITVSRLTYEMLQDRSDDEGRSLSNLASFLLELALSPGEPWASHPDRTSP